MFYFVKIVPNVAIVNGGNAANIGTNISTNTILQSLKHRLSYLLPKSYIIKTLHSQFVIILISRDDYFTAGTITTHVVPFYLIMI